MEEEPERADRANKIADRMRTSYAELGYRVGETTPIVPILIEDQLTAIKTWKALFDAGVYTNIALPPAVPADGALFCTSYMATHTDAQMARVLDAFACVGNCERLI